MLRAVTELPADLLKALPEVAWGPIAKMLNLIEQEQDRCTDPLVQVSLILIPRKDTGEGNPRVPLKVHDICDGVIYRTWASLSAEQLGKTRGPIATPSERFGRCERPLSQVGELG